MLQRLKRQLPEEQLLDAGELPFACKLIRSKRRTLAVGVEGNLVVVRAPARAPLSWILSFLDEKQDWIQRQLALEAEREATRLRLAPGTMLSVAGQTWTIDVESCEQRRKASTVAQPPRLQIRLPEHGRQSLDQRLHQAFFRWLHSEAEAYMVPRTQEIARIQGLDDRLQKVRFRRTKSQWGHCSASGDLQFNPLIMLAPVEVIDYLIAHELAHLVHRNHSRRFWARVEKIDPNYRESERWLKQEGYRLAIEMPAS